MSNDSDILLQLHDQAWSMIRHYENQRTTVTNFVLVMVSIAVGFIVQQKMSSNILPIAVLIIVLGVYGAFAVHKLYERSQLSLTFAKHYLDRLNELNPEIDIKQLHNNIRTEHKRKFSTVRKLHMHHVWFILHIAIALVGLILVVVIIVS